MRILGNVLWHFPFLGFVNAILTYLIGLLLTMTIVAAPIGLGLMEFGKFLFAPFTRSMVRKSDLNIDQNEAWKIYSGIVLIIYLPIGIILTVVSIIHVGVLFISIIGIPAALVVAKSLGTLLNPVNKKCVHYAVASELEQRAARSEVNRYLGDQQ